MTLSSINNRKISELPVKTSWEWYSIAILYFLYFTHSALFSGTAIIGQLLIFIIAAIGLVCLLKTIFRQSKMPAVLILIMILLSILTISFITSPKIVYSRILPPTPTLNQFKDMVAFFVPVFTGFRIGLKKKVLSKEWLIISLMLLAMAIISFLFNKSKLALLFNREETTNNAAYMFLYIVPFIPLFIQKYKIISLGLIATVFAFVMMGAKRGAILCMGLLILYLLIWYTRNNRISFSTILVIAVIIFGAIIGVEYYFSTSDYLQQRLEQTLEGNSSNRDSLYDVLWNAWLNADAFTQWFGRGIAQTVTVAENYAHNDWLELLTDVGLIGALIYLSIFISLFRFRKKLKPNSPERTALTATLLFLFSKTLFSMGIGIMGGIDMMLLGTLMGNVVFETKRRKLLLKYSENAATR